MRVIRGIARAREQIDRGGVVELNREFSPEMPCGDESVGAGGSGHELSTRRSDLS